MERVSPDPDGLVVEAVSTTRPGRCPDCRHRASRVHSSYQRRLSERPVGSQRVVVRLRVRRYFCDRRNCSRKTFAEQIDGLTERYRRSSVGLKGWLRSVAAELGGRAGERLCRRLRLAAGRTRLLEEASPASCGTGSATSPRRTRALARHGGAALARMGLCPDRWPGDVKGRNIRR
ncbi:transposase family protein [Streptomyces sp. VNUA116]|uniref:transposase family protein n=1 Tax=Streptomyces sp. VNUA116 TaxID=3062449 RepID=UPI0034A0857C